MKVYITDTQEIKSIECLDAPWGLDVSEYVLEMFIPHGVAQEPSDRRGAAELTSQQFEFFAKDNNLSKIIKAVWGVDTVQTVE